MVVCKVHKCLQEQRTVLNVLKSDYIKIINPKKYINWTTCETAKSSGISKASFWINGMSAINCTHYVIYFQFSYKGKYTTSHWQ